MTFFIISNYDKLLWCIEGNMMKKLLILLLIPFIFTSCSNQNTNSSGSNNDPVEPGEPGEPSDPEDPIVDPGEPSDPKDPSEPGEPTEPGEPEEPEVKTFKYTVDFEADYINTTATDSSKFSEVMIANFNHTDDVLESVDFEGYAQINTLGVTALLVSSAKKDGVLTFNFLKDLVSITITASPYKKYIDYNQSYSIDDSPLLMVNKEEWAFENATETKDPDRVNKSFKINSKTLKVEGTAGRRVFIHTLEMEFVDEQD